MITHWTFTRHNLLHATVSSKVDEFVSFIFTTQSGGVHLDHFYVISFVI